MVVQSFLLKSALNILFFFQSQLLSTCFTKVLSLPLNLQKIESINHLWKEIALLPVTVPLSMFCLCAGKLNEDLCERAEGLKDEIVMFEVEENRELNKGLVAVLAYCVHYCACINLKRHNVKQGSFFSPRICQKYEEITKTIRSTPATTEELVSLTQFIKTTSDVTVHKLIDEIEEASYRLSFLLDYAILPCM